ncbi:MAG TPA: GNAT family N-acetyltransferase [Terracidiphilus sp.]|nr:GNAT family N-acetyltransferase [Terracidiphilus sp.]
MPSEAIDNQSGSGAYSVDLITSLDEVRAMQDTWDRLSGQMLKPNVFSTSAWYESWIEQLMREAAPGTLQPFLLVLRKQGKVAAVAPLVRRIVSRNGLCVRKLEFLTHHADYNDLLVGHWDEHTLQATVQHFAHVASDWELIDLQELRSSSSPADDLLSSALSAGLKGTAWPERESCFYLPIDAPWHLMRLRSGMDFAARAIRDFAMYEKDGFRVRIADKPHLEPGLLRRMIAVEAQKKYQGILSAPVIGQYPEVFQSLINKMGPRSEIAIALAEKHDSLIAFALLFRSGNKLLGYLTAYDRMYASYSPGTVLFSAAIEFGSERRYDEFDLLRGGEEYKRRWSTLFHKNNRVLLWNPRWKSRFAAWALGRKLKQAASQASQLNEFAHSAEMGDDGDA